MKKLLVTGCGRSGTAYTTQLLNAWGVLVGHEKQQKDGCVSWYEMPNIKNYSIVLHQYRHPLKVIASMQTASAFSWNYIYQQSGVQGKNPIYRSAEYWIVWNEMILNRNPDITYNIERIPEKEICKLLGVQWKPVKLRRDINTRKGITPLQWSDLGQYESEVKRLFNKLEKL